VLRNVGVTRKNQFVLMSAARSSLICCCDTFRPGTLFT
jgi:hypothetical protein